MLHTRAHAKINLFLHVTGRRPNGYHELDSLAVFAQTADDLSLAIEGTGDKVMSMAINGPFGTGLDAGPDNLVLKAAQALRQATGSSAFLPNGQMTLTKNLPVASGIGGGSADAAAALRLLASAWGLEGFDLGPVAATLGADVPVCLRSETQRMQGIGEILVAAPALPQCALLLVNPGVAVPTPPVFQAWKESTASFSPQAVLPDGWQHVEGMVETLRSTSNDLQKPAIALFPVIGKVLDELDRDTNCLFARMSGSGATCFGLYATVAEAEAHATVMRQKGWWAEAGWIQTGQNGE